MAFFWRAITGLLISKSLDWIIPAIGARSMAGLLVVTKSMRVEDGEAAEDNRGLKGECSDEIFPDLVDLFFLTPLPLADC